MMVEVKTGITMPQVYISGALTSAPTRQRKFYEQIAEVCKRHELEPYLPHLHTDPVLHPEYTPKMVYAINSGNVGRSRLLIAYVGVPSLGTGAEVELANMCSIPVILLFEEGRRVSRHILGVSSVVRKIEFSSRKDCIRRLSVYMKRISRDLVGEWE